MFASVSGQQAIKLEPMPESPGFLASPFSAGQSSTLATPAKRKPRLAESEEELEVSIVNER